MVLFRDAIILLPALISHSFAGMYAAPIKWKRIYVAGIWAVWTVLMLCLLTWVQKKADPGTPAIISNFAVMYLGQITIFLITTKGNLLYRLCRCGEETPDQPEQLIHAMLTDKRILWSHHRKTR